MPPNFPGVPFGFRGPPLELLTIELAYFLAIAAVCLIIYLKANEVYRLSQRRGVYHFRNIFLYFSVSYLFRFLHLALIASEDVFSIDLSSLAMRVTLFLVAYFSTMAILSLAMAALVRGREIAAGRKVPFVLHGIALVLSLLAALPRSNSILIALQTALVLGSVALVFLNLGKGRHRKLLSQNRAAFLLLAAFWIVNLLAFSQRLFPIQAKIPAYVVSIAVFISIFLRVNKRLPSNAKKKRPA